jgi:ferrous iron transport protein B
LRPNHGLRSSRDHRRHPESGKKLSVALAGNANVGKSVIFNELTGLHQHVGNWPGKTVERAEGTLFFGGYVVDVVDLPGIYSLSTYSIEELVSREYIAVEHPDVLVNVVDASALERNLFFTLQLLELEPHMVIALNQVDLAEGKGIRIDPEKLSELLGVPVIPTVAIKGVGLGELMSQIVEMVESGESEASSHVYGPEVERWIGALVEGLRTVETPYPSRWVAIKLLERDEEIEQAIYQQNPELRTLVEEASRNVEEIHGHDAFSVLASERYSLASRIAATASQTVEPEKTFVDRLEDLTSHPVLGYVFLVTAVLTIFFTIFSLGDYVTGLLDVVFQGLKNSYFATFGGGVISTFIWDGVVDGVLGGVGIALPYIVPFYVVFSVLEDSGYLARIAFLMDSVMHRIGLHGKAFIPLMLGFGCNVPACLACRIMETERERLICAFVASLVPCAARSIVIMGLVAEYVGFQWALLLYVIDFILIFVLGRFAYKAVPGEPVGLIMEMPSYRLPSIMILGNLVIVLAGKIGLLAVVQDLMSPVTVLWLGLPAATGVVLIFGVLRKELTLILLASMMGTNNFALILTPAQMFVFAFVVMIYIPCIATIAVLAKEFGNRNAAIITVSEIGLAVVLGGIIFRILTFIGLP